VLLDVIQLAGYKPELQTSGSYTGTAFNIHGVVCSVVLVGVVTWVVLSFRYVKRKENEMSSTFQFNEF
jgi:hypothetical protein